MTKPKGATHYDFKKSCFYKINEKFYKYNGFGWCEVKEVNLKNCIEVWENDRTKKHGKRSEN